MISTGRKEELEQEQIVGEVTRREYISNCALAVLIFLQVLIDGTDPIFSADGSREVCL